MIDFNDPDMMELVTGFCDESDGLIKELNQSLEKFEEDLNRKHLETFGQVIDRMMGAAQSLGAEDVGKFCEMGKMIGYKASQASDPELLKLASPILMDAVELITTMINHLRNGQNQTKENLPLEAFASRLKWYLEKFKDIERSSVAIKKK